MRATSIFIVLIAFIQGTAGAGVDERPNILFVIADDWSHGHAGVYGDALVNTPNIDAVAARGAIFLSAFSAAPSCTPSRAALLTGRYPHELEAGASLWGFLPKKFENYCTLLEKAGYHVGLAGKGWGPGNFERGGYTQNPAGRSYGDFPSFYREKPPDKPFSFWFGSQNPHRPYAPGSGTAAGKNADDVDVPAWLPDVATVRQDILDYYFEVEQFDRQLGEILAVLQREGVLDNTLVIITGDNGMPFPRAKATLYDGGVKVPLIMSLAGRILPGSKIDALVSLIDIAPTILEAAGEPVPASMRGASLWPLLKNRRAPGRNAVFFERERHANVRRPELGYPARAIRTAQYLYIRNYAPERWPAGDPELYHSVGPFGDVDGSPSKAYMLEYRADPAVAPYFQLAFSKRPAEELYDLKADPEQLQNVAAVGKHSKALDKLREQLARWQDETGDPRLTNSHDVAFDKYPYFGPPASGAPSRYVPQ